MTKREYISAFKKAYIQEIQELTGADASTIEHVFRVEYPVAVFDKFLDEKDYAEFTSQTAESDAVECAADDYLSHAPDGEVSKSSDLRRLASPVIIDVSSNA